MDSQQKSSPRQPKGHERRTGEDRRVLEALTTVRVPTWQEQKTQFLTRYLFWVLAMAFFNLSKGVTPAWLTMAQMNTSLVIYVCCVTALFLHAGHDLFCPTRFRLAMWLDIIIVTIAVVNDPYPLPPSELVFIVVVLGNGMRYGMRIFAEALIGAFAAVALALTFRFMGGDQVISPGLIFLNLFGGIILIYSYILMGRIERTRHQLERQSRLDPLTGVMNRRALFQCAEPLFRKMERNDSSLTVLFADLDKFKEVNDSFGHSTGDKVLVDIATILRNSVRAYDMVARQGGDEFVLLLPDANLAQANQTIHRIRQAVHEYAAKNDLNLSITFGLGEAPRHGRTLTEILDKVDSALYRAKKNNNRDGIEWVGGTPLPTTESPTLKPVSEELNRT